jgi:predicted nucleic acid-binding Zn ribbon protein
VLGGKSISQCEKYESECREYISGWGIIFQSVGKNVKKVFQSVEECEKKISECGENVKKVFQSVGKM